MSYFKRYWTFYASKLFQLFPKNLIVIFGGQNWLIPYIVLSSMYFRYFFIIYPWEKNGAKLHYRIKDLITPITDRVQVNFVFAYCTMMLTNHIADFKCSAVFFKIVVAFSCHIVTQLNPIYTRVACFMQSLVGSREKDFLIFINKLLSLFEKECAPLFEQTWNPFTQGCFMQSLVEIAQWF